uniref:hypothetical protein n=1 Tax=uncultured Clostridium sp. TaxID=59620 RepID=UPI0025FC7988
MEIREILKRTQPELYEKLNKRDRNNKRSSKKRKENKVNLNEKDIKELMDHSSYRRYSGAIRQIK